MCCEQLVCASCNGRVTDGNCGTCRTARAELHGDHSGRGLAVPVPLIALVAALTLLLLLVLHHSG